ncbi:MAG: hypothetical protein JW743_06925 [Deltaproteobacteria bacterium]|nr:hypothetical protein [Deltaproteobacteria bacterium]MBN2844804.1 hypothetical protein [Deltaproteobacteria bacterium]
MESFLSATWQASLIQVDTPIRGSMYACKTIHAVIIKNKIAISFIG